MSLICLPRFAAYAPSSHNWSLETSSEPTISSSKSFLLTVKERNQFNIQIRPWNPRVRRSTSLSCGCGVHRRRGFGEHCLGVVGNLCFGIQIYCDFSAYSESQSARPCWILCENFKTRYAARSHRTGFLAKVDISVSTWPRLPLHLTGWKPKGQRRLYIALMTTMALGGLWHGASWNFVLWGVVHGLILIGHRPAGGSAVCPPAFERIVAGAVGGISWMVHHAGSGLLDVAAAHRVEDTKCSWRHAGFLFLHMESLRTLQRNREVRPARSATPDHGSGGVFILMHGTSRGRPRTVA